MGFIFFLIRFSSSSDRRLIAHTGCIIVFVLIALMISDVQFMQFLLKRYMNSLHATYIYIYFI